MQIFAIKGSDHPEQVQKVYESIYNGFSRFGWGFHSSQNLNEISRDLSNLNEYQKETWQKGKFLLDVKEGDWIVHINTPSYGRCVAVKVKNGYEFDKGLFFDDANLDPDFSHRLAVDTNSIIEFDRNNDAVVPAVSRRLKLQGSSWQIHTKKEWEQTIENLRNGIDTGADKKEIYYLKQDVDSVLNQLASEVHKNNPEKKLEPFIAAVLQNVPTVESAEVNGSGRGTDYGADVVATINEGIDIAGLLEQRTLVAQVKSYKGYIDDQKAIDQILNAVDVYNADYGLILSTAEPTKNFLDKVDQASGKKGESDGAYNDDEISFQRAKISVLGGKEFMKFILKYGSSQLFDTY